MEFLLVVGDLTGVKFVDLIVVFQEVPVLVFSVIGRDLMIIPKRHASYRESNRTPAKYGMFIAIFIKIRFDV